jgi:hypothetical protein
VVSCGGAMVVAVVFSPLREEEKRTGKDSLWWRRYVEGRG